MSENILNNNILASMVQRAAPGVVNAIKTASAKTGVDFAYLVEQAAAESSFDADAESGTSSATGLYQFIESTWMDMVKRHGHKYGLEELAAKIDDNGRVADKAAMDEILELRKDPEKAALLAAEFASENKRYLKSHVGGDIGATELYLAHFMGAGGATGFLNAMKENPLMTAADLFPKAARANRSVFYDRETGDARTLAGVYDFFAKKFQGSESRTTGTQENPVPASPMRKPSYNKPGLTSGIQAQALSAENAMSRSLLNVLAGDNAAGNGWETSPFGGPASLVSNPVELMMMAEMKLPHERQRYND